jgi:hypothetical protein
MGVLNFSDSTLKFHTAAMFIIAIEYVMYSIFLPYLHTKFHVPVSNGSLAITMKPKAERQLCY